MDDQTGRITDFIEKQWRPKVQADGGEIRFVSYMNNTVTVKFSGECARCCNLKCFCEFLHSELKTEFGDELILEKIIEKPYFAK
jgi:Fe-S cluster biogenesis protein NfuA